MPDPLSIREAEAADLPAVLSLHAQSEFDDGKILPVAEAQAIFERFRDYPEYRLYVAESEGAVVGSFALLVMDNLGHLGTPSAIVDDVVVEPERQGSGIGRAMMREAAALARAQGCYKLRLSSNRKRDGTLAFYDSLGFERHGYSFRLGLERSEP